MIGHIALCQLLLHHVVLYELHQQYRYIVFCQEHHEFSHIVQIPWYILYTYMYTVLYHVQVTVQMSPLVSLPEDYSSHWVLMPPNHLWIPLLWLTW